MTSGGLSSGPRGWWSGDGHPTTSSVRLLDHARQRRYPVAPEVVNQLSFQVIGGGILTITLAAEAGQLQLNVMEPAIAYNILQSITLLTNAVHVLREKCVSGITANPGSLPRTSRSQHGGGNGADPDHRLREGCRPRQEGPRRAASRFGRSCTVSLIFPRPCWNVSRILLLLTRPSRARAIKSKTPAEGLVAGT